MLTNIKARDIAIISLERAFKDAGLVDGKSLRPEQIKATKTPLYWRNAVTIDIGKSKPLYVVYDIIDSSETTAADDKTVCRAVLAVLRIWSTSSFESKLLRGSLRAIEGALINAGWVVALDTEYIINDRYNQPITASYIVMDKEE